MLQFEKDLVGGGQHGAANQLTVASLSHRYLWQPGAVDQLMADEQLLSSPEGGEGQGGNGRDKGYDLSQPGEVAWPLTDQQGTVRDLAVHDAETDLTTVANHRVYDSYGNLKSQTNAAVDCLFGFTGRPFDEVTGLQNNLNRWYDAKVGRWVTVDPIGFEGRDANEYRYCGNSSTSCVDPEGLDPYPGWPSQPTPNSIPHGTWGPAEFFRKILHGWLYEKCIYGCGGLAAWRVFGDLYDGPFTPWAFKTLPGVFAYSDFGHAVQRLRNLFNDGQGGLIVAFQSDKPFIWSARAGQTGVVNLDDVNGVPGSWITLAVGAQQNWASFLNSPSGPYWEWANHAWQKDPHDNDPNDPPEIYHSDSPPTWYTVYLVVPYQGGSQSPVPHP